MIVIVSVTMSCTKKDSADKNLLPGRCRISCTINGDVSLSFHSDDAYSFSAYNSVSMVLEPEIRNISTGNREHISLLVPVNIKTDTYLLSDAGAPAISFSFTKDNIYSGVGKTWSATVGNNITFVITKASYTELEGTFSGTAISGTDSTEVTITNGKFYAIFSH